MKHSWILALFLTQASSSLLGMRLRRDDQVWGAGNGEKHAAHRRFDEYESSGGFESEYFEGFGSGFNDVPQHDYGQFNSDTVRLLHNLCESFFEYNNWTQNVLIILETIMNMLSYFKQWYFIIEML